MDVGRCKGAFESWAYEVATGTCVEFKYTGCGGNQNRFGTKEACEALCLRPAGSEESAGEDFGKLGKLFFFNIHVVGFKAKIMRFSEG